LKEPTLWTNPLYVGVLNYGLWNGREVVQGGRTLSAFRAYLENQKLPFLYDHAFGLLE
jgi:hypothetical protein